MNIFLYISFIICFGCSKEPSHRDGSFEYPQHMFWLRNKKLLFDYWPAYMSLFRSALAAIQWGLKSYFWPDPLSKALTSPCTPVQACLSLHCLPGIYVISAKISCAGSFDSISTRLLPFNFLLIL